jgi:hypothetical protein
MWQAFDNYLFPHKKAALKELPFLMQRPGS